MSNETMTDLISRVKKLGIKCNHSPLTDRIDGPADRRGCLFPDVHGLRGVSSSVNRKPPKWCWTKSTRRPLSSGTHTTRCISPFSTGPIRQ